MENLQEVLSLIMDKITHLEGRSNQENCNNNTQNRHDYHRRHNYDTRKGRRNQHYNNDSRNGRQNYNGKGNGRQNYNDKRNGRQNYNDKRNERKNNSGHQNKHQNAQDGRNVRQNSTQETQNERFWSTNENWKPIFKTAFKITQLRHHEWIWTDEEIPKPIDKRISQVFQFLAPPAPNEILKKDLMEMEKRWKEELQMRINLHLNSAITECAEKLEGMKSETEEEHDALVKLVVRKMVKRYGKKADESFILEMIGDDIGILAENGFLSAQRETEVEDPPRKPKPTSNPNPVTTTAVMEHQHNTKSSPAKQKPASAAKQPSPSTARQTPSSPATKKTGENQQISKTNAANNSKQQKDTNPDMSITIEDDDDDDTVEAASPEPKKLKQTTLTVSQTKRTVKEIPAMGNRPKGLGNKK